MSSAANSIRRLVLRASEIPKEKERGPAPYMHFQLMTVNGNSLQINMRYKNSNSTGCSFILSNLPTTPYKGG